MGTSRLSGSPTLDTMSQDLRGDSPTASKHTETALILFFLFLLSSLCLNQGTTTSYGLENDGPRVGFPKQSTTLPT